MKRMAAWTAACLALAIVGCHKETEPPTAPPEKKESRGNTPFLVKFEAERVDGGKVTLESLKGRVVLVDLFGTWCPPCRRATPVIVSLYERYRTQGFEVVGLAYERTETVEAAKEAVLAFKQEYGVPYVLAIGPEAVKEQIPGGFEGYPTMVLVDRQGVGRRHFVGFSPGEEAVLGEEIEKLLAEPMGSAPAAAPIGGHGAGTPEWSRFVALLGQPIDSVEVKRFVEQYGLKQYQKFDSGGFDRNDVHGFSLLYRKNRISRVVVVVSRDAGPGLEGPTYAGPLPQGLQPTDTPEDAIKRLGKPAHQPERDYLLYEYDTQGLVLSFSRTTHKLLEIDLDAPQPKEEPADAADALKAAAGAPFIVERPDGRSGGAGVGREMINAPAALRATGGFEEPGGGTNREREQP